MNRREYETAITREVENWPGAAVTFVEQGKHPAARLTFGDLIQKVTYPGTPSDSAFGLRKCLGNIRRALRGLDATRDKPEPTAEEDEAPYRKPPPAPAVKVPAPETSDDREALGSPTGDLAALSASMPRDDPATPKGDAWDKPERQVPADPEIKAEVVLPIDLPDGVYFDLPADAYHNIRRLSTSGIQRMTVSPATFWAESWLNPDRKPEDETITKARLLGRCYHTARLEPEKLDLEYARAPDKADFPAEDAVYTATDIEAALVELGQPKTQKGELVADKAQRLEDAGFAGTIWPLEQARFQRRLAGRIPIPAKDWDEIVIDMKRLRQNAEIAALLTGGFAEVTVLWTDANGIAMKARLDYLAVAHWTDFKTFANPRRKLLLDAISDAFRYDRYYTQAVNYREAVELIRAGVLTTAGEATDDQRRLIHEIAGNPAPLDCWYVFQEKGGVPNILARRFKFFHVIPSMERQSTGIDDEHRRRVEELASTPTKIHYKGKHEIAAAKRNYLAYQEIYEPGEPWFPINPVGELGDDDFNRFWLDE